MPNKTTGRQWVKFILIVFGFVFLLTALYMRLLSVRESASEEQEEKPPTPVRAIDVSREDVWLYKSVLGRVEGVQAVTIYTEVSGWVKEIKADRGDTVKTDDIIVTLDDQKTGYNLSESEGRLNSARAELEEARRLYRQNEKLYEKGIIARDTLESSLNQLRAKESTVNSLEAAWKRQKFDYEQLKIKTPINGRVVEIYPDVGQELQVNDRVARIVNSEEKQIVAGVTSSMAKSVSAGTEVRIYPGETVPGVPQNGYITGISEDVDESSSLYTLELGMDDKQQDLLPGEIVTLQIPVEKLENVVKVPVTSLYSDNDDYYLFISENNVAKRIEIDEVRWINDNFGVIDHEALPRDSMIITEGSAALNDGDKLKILN